MKKIISLDGKWRFTHVLDQRPDNNHSLYDGEVPLYATDKIYRTDWINVNVPGVWEKYAEKYALFEGVCWYYRTFEVEELTEDTVAQLRFGGVIYRADIYLNNEYVGFHESGYVEFTRDITKFIKQGTNCLALCVDNRPLIVKWPHDWGYFNFGGIHGSVSLELMSGEYIDSLSLTPDYDCEKGQGLLRVKGTLKHFDGSRITVSVAGRTAVLDAKADGEFDEILKIDGINAWTPDEPLLYECTVRIGEEVFEEKRVGFRNIKTQNAKILLNGNPFFCKGCCYLYDSPEHGLTASLEQMRYDLSEMKEAGINAIRTHYPMDEIFYRLCDEMGFVSWIELPVYCSKPSREETNTVFARPEYIENAQMILCEMIALARSHASVIIYSIGNECNIEHPEALPFFTVMANTVRETDDTRLVGYASLYGLVGEMGSILDVLGMNCYDGWYNKITEYYHYEEKEVENGAVKLPEIVLGRFHALANELDEKLPKDLPIVLSEFGGDSVPGFRSCSMDYWSEEYHAEVVKKTVLAVREHENRFAGTFVFAFTDYHDPSKPQNGFWNEYNLKGMLSYHRDRKLPFYALKEVYTSEKK